jgi:hypothetical protein
VQYYLLVFAFIQKLPILLVLLVTSTVAYVLFANTQPEHAELAMPKAALTVLVAGFWLEPTEDAKRKKRKVKTSKGHSSFVYVLRAWTGLYVAYKTNKIVLEYTLFTLLSTRYDSNQAID